MIVVAHFADRERRSYRIGFPREELWRLRLHSDWGGYGRVFGNFQAADVETAGAPQDGYAYAGEIRIDPYTLLVSSQ